MKLSNQDLNEIISMKTVIKKPKIHDKIYLTRIQYYYLQLIRNITKFIFIKDENFKKVLIKILDKEKLTENQVSENKKDVIRLVKSNPENLYKFIYKKLSENDIKQMNIIKSHIMCNYDLKCIKCHRLCQKFNLCEKHNKEEGIFEKILSDALKNINLETLKNFFSVLERELLNRMKTLEKLEKREENITYKVNRIKSLIKYCQDNNDDILINIINNFVYYNSKELRKVFNLQGKKYDKKKNDNAVEIIKKYIQENDIKSINKNASNEFKEKQTLETDDKRIGKDAIISNIKYHMNFVNRVIYFIDNNLIQKSDITDIILNINTEYFIEKEISYNTLCTSRTLLFEKLFGSKYNLRNLTTNKYFEDHYYNTNLSLTYDIYGEVYNEHHKIYIPFIININRHNIKLNSSIIKKFYCFISNITFLDIKGLDYDLVIKFMEYISKEKIFFVFGNLL
ncbi:hypothetical protein Catovirus_2_29 [Catovirus CTV1]|uniref:Uncharacterized protein n=1 Tax=Catovirus CTV1 TaxID=1977631 RepID=A0A1V0SBH7_9VIRU|nr:hypothetical protein Catovirus_2_29 [Catovirus CTV1]